MKPAIAQVSTLAFSFEQDVDDFAASHCPALEIWLTKLETYLEQHSLDAARDLLSANGLEAPVAASQGGLLTSQGEARREAWALFRRRLELCRQLGIGTLVVAGDIAGPLSQPDVERVQVSLVEAAQAAGQHQMRVAFEFHGKAAFANNLQTAAALVEEVGSPHLGLCLDMFHYYIGPSKLYDLGYLTRENLFHVQLSDLAHVPREFASDSDRIIPGDGEIPLDALLARLREIGYEGYLSLELMNPQLWQVSPRQLGEIGMTALRKLLGQASME